MNVSLKEYEIQSLESCMSVPLPRVCSNRMLGAGCSVLVTGVLGSAVAKLANQCPDFIYGPPCMACSFWQFFGGKDRHHFGSVMVACFVTAEWLVLLVGVVPPEVMFLLPQCALQYLSSDTNTCWLHAGLRCGHWRKTFLGVS